MKPYILNGARKELLLIAEVSLSLEVNEKKDGITSLFIDMSSWGSKLLEQPYSFSCVKEVGGTYSNGAIQVRKSPRHMHYKIFTLDSHWKVDPRCISNINIFVAGFGQVRAVCLDQAFFLAIRKKTQGEKNSKLKGKTKTQAQNSIFRHFLKKLLSLKTCFYLF